MTNPKLFQLNIVSLALVITLSSIPTPALAEGELSYNASLVSKYLWRGFDLSNENPAFQGGIDYEHESGVYAGVWASQYDFAEEDEGVEVDIYLGYSVDLNDDFYIDASVTNYQYTGDTDSSIEWKVGIVHERFELNYWHDQDLDTNYLELNGNYPINEKIVAGAHYGINNDGEESYSDYSLSLTYVISDLWELKLGYSSHEFDEKLAENTVFAGVFAYF